MEKNLKSNRSSNDIKTICFYSFNLNNASAYLRFFGPIRHLGINAIEGVENSRVFVERVSQADIVVLQRDFPRVLDDYERIITLARKENKPVILDLDDLILDLPEEHTDRRQLVYFESLIPIMRSLIEVDLVTVSTQLLRKYVLNFNNNVIVLPNFLDDDLWHLKPPSRESKQDKSIIIGFMGNQTHQTDFALIEPVLLNLVKLYPDNLQFHFWGMQPPANLKSIPQTQWHDQIKPQYTEFASYFQTQSANIFVAPLIDNLFNNCKSHIKYLEYSALGVPGVYSRVETYSQVITHGKNGLLASTYEEWKECLISLIEDEELRSTIARNAQSDISSNWLLSKNAHLWLEAYQTSFSKKVDKREHVPTYLNLFRSLSRQMKFWQDDKNKNLELLNSQILERDNNVRELNAHLTELKQVEKALVKQLQERDQKIKESEQSIEEIKSSNAWKIAMMLRQIRLIIAPPNTWRDSILKRLVNTYLSMVRKLEEDRKIEQNLALIRSSDLFNEEWYLTKYPSVAKDEIDPLRHYLLIGGFEGYDPGPNFNSNWYLNTYTDVQKARINPLVHYLKYGIHEGRQVLKAFLIQENRSVEKNLAIEVPRIKESRANNLVKQVTGGETSIRKVGKRISYLAMRSIQILKRDGFIYLAKKINQKVDNNFGPNISRLEPVEFDVSIIIPVFNAVNLTRNCIDKIYATYNRATFEVIVIDNYSSDETSKYLQAERLKHRNLSFYRMPKNLGFSGAVNEGFLHAKGKYIIILNNDTLVTFGWMDRLIETFQKDEVIGIVSPITNYVGEGPQIDPEAVELQLSEIDDFARKIVDRKFFYEPHRLVFFCVALKREVVDLIGYLDVGYEKGNFEDDDYCMRVILAGFKLAIARDSFVYHFGTMTFKKNRISHVDFMERNRKRFYQKSQNLSTTLRPANRQVGQLNVNVIIRTLNRPDLLKNALTSLTNQTYKDFEVVIVNDGGTDISNLLSIYEKYFPIIYIYHTVSKGRTVALNAGINQSKREWITFLDDDDIVYPWHLDTLASGTKANIGEAFFYTNHNKTLFTSHLEKYPIAIKGAEPWDFNKRDLLVRNFIPIHTWMVSRSCFDQVGNFLETQEMLEDYDFLVRLSKVYNFIHINRVTCEYRFYLDGVNSMVNQRPKTLDALKFIYSRNSVKDPNLVRERGLELEGLNLQIRKIEELNSMLSEDPEKNTEIYLKIINLISGM